MGLPNDIDNANQKITEELAKAFVQSFSIYTQNVDILVLIFNFLDC